MTRTHAWHGNAHTKLDVVDRLRGLAAAGQLTQHPGVRDQAHAGLGPHLFGPPTRGRLPWHRRVGFPRDLARVIDATFEALPADEGAAFAPAVLDAAPAGGNLDLVVVAVAADILTDARYGPAAALEPDSSDRRAVDTAAAVLACRAAGEEVPAALAAAAWAARRRPCNGYGLPTPVVAARCMTERALDGQDVQVVLAAAVSSTRPPVEVHRWIAARLIHRTAHAPSLLLSAAR